MKWGRFSTCPQRKGRLKTCPTAVGCETRPLRAQQKSSSLRTLASRGQCDVDGKQRNDELACLKVLNSRDYTLVVPVGAGAPFLNSVKLSRLFLSASSLAKACSGVPVAPGGGRMNLNS